MTKVKKMRGHTESETVLVMINGALTSVRGVKKRSTCNDVINMATTGVTMEGKSHDVLALFESSNGVERLLSPGTNILKVIRSWGNDNSYYLVLKPTDCMKAKMATASRTKRNLHKLISVMSSKKSTANRNDIANNVDNCMKTTKTKPLGEFEAKPDNLCEKKGKLALFHRYISDVMCHITKSAATTSYHTENQSGPIFHENSEVPTDGVYMSVPDCNDTYTIYSDEEDIDDYNDYLDLNMAFVDEALANADKLHCEVHNEMVDTSNSITSDESGFDEDSVCSIDELEKNVFDCDLDVTVVHKEWLPEGLTPTKNTVIRHQRIKSIVSEGVSNGCISSLDDAMASLMNTLSNLSKYADCDDALSSLGSNMGSV